MLASGVSHCWIRPSLHIRAAFLKYHLKQDVYDRSYVHIIFITQLHQHPELMHKIKMGLFCFFLSKIGFTLKTWWIIKYFLGSPLPLKPSNPPASAEIWERN